MELQWTHSRPKRYQLGHFQCNACGGKNWKPYNASREVKSYFHCVTASDKVFGLFLLRNYLDLLSFIKKPVQGQRGQEDSTTKITKEKLSGRKQKEAIEDYNIWFRQFKILWKKTNPFDSHISIDIDKHCNRISFAENKTNQKRNTKIVCQHKLAGAGSSFIAFLTCVPWRPSLFHFYFKIHFISFLFHWC